MWAIKIKKELIEWNPGSVDTGITPNVSMMCGLEAEKEDARKGPYADTLVRDRAFNGVKKKRG